MGHRVRTLCFYGLWSAVHTPFFFFFLVQMLIDGLVGADLSYGTFHLTWRPADKKRERHYGVLLQVTPYGVHMVFCC